MISAELSGGSLLSDATGKKQKSAERESQAARACLSFLLKSLPLPYTDDRPLRLQKDECGKPFLSRQGGRYDTSLPSLSLAHTHRFAMAAIDTTGADLGADIEEIARFESPGIVRRFFTPREFQIAETAQQRATVWCQKEALAKNTGKGLCREVFETDTASDDNHDYFTLPTAILPSGTVASICTSNNNGAPIYLPFTHEDKTV